MNTSDLLRWRKTSFFIFLENKTKLVVLPNIVLASYLTQLGKFSTESESNSGHILHWICLIQI